MVYHKPAAEPYVTPYMSDHPRHVFENMTQTSVARAVRYSSTYEAFQNEQRSIRLMLLPRSITPSRKRPYTNHLRQKTSAVYSDPLRQSYTMFYGVLRSSQTVVNDDQLLSLKIH